MRDGPMVSLAKIMLMIITFTMINIRPKFFFGLFDFKKKSQLIRLHKTVGRFSTEGIGTGFEDLCNFLMF